MDLLKLIQILLLALLLFFALWSLLCPLWGRAVALHAALLRNRPRAESILNTILSTPVPFYLAPLIVLLMVLMWTVGMVAQQRVGFFPEQFILHGEHPVAVIGQYFTGFAKWFWAALGVVLLFAGWWFRPRRSAAPVPLAPIVVLLALLGLLLLLRLGPDLYRYSRREYLMTLVTKQVLFVSLGLVLMIAASGRAGVALLRLCARYPVPLAVATIILCLFTLFFGVERNNHRLWINLGFFELQVTEVVKPVFALATASGLSALLLGEPRPRAWARVGAALGLLAMLFLMRDLGPLAQCVLLLALLMACVGRVGWGLLVLVLAVAGGAAAYGLGWPATVRERVDLWLHPFSSFADHIAQALWAISDGGWFGAGLSRGQAATIPEIHTDVIPALIAEELGFCGIAAVLLLYAGLARCGFAIARRAREPFAALTALAITVLIVSQAVMIMCGTAGLIPLTGITLPLVSAGGSSMLTTFLALGLLIACGRDWEAQRPAAPPAKVGAPEPPQAEMPKSETDL